MLAHAAALTAVSRAQHTNRVAVANARSFATSAAAAAASAFQFGEGLVGSGAKSPN
jgi:hypothetical protein